MDSPEEPTGLEFGTLDMAVPLAASANARCSWLLATGRAVCCPQEGRKHLAGPPGQPPGREALDPVFPGGRPTWGCEDLLSAGLVSSRPPQPGPVPPPLLDSSSNGSYKNNTWLLTPVAWRSWRSHVP